MHIGYRRAPAATDLLCPVCTGLVPAASTGLAFDLLDPGRMPHTLTTMHAVCFNALSLTTDSVFEARQKPKGPSMDPEGAVVVIHETVRFRVSGARRTEVADAVREAIATFKSGTAREPIVAFVRRSVIGSVGPLIRNVAENPGPPPHLRGPHDPSMTVTFDTAAPNRHGEVLAKFTIRPVSDIPAHHPRYRDAEAEIIAFICQRADAGADLRTIKDDLARLPRVASIILRAPAGTTFDPRAPAPVDGYVVSVDPNRSAPSSRQTGATTTQGPPIGNYNPLPNGTGFPTPAGGMSPNAGDNRGGDNGSGAGSDSTATGGPLPPPGEVTRAMLPPLDTPEAIAARPGIAKALREGLTRAFPDIGITGVTVDRDPSTLSEVVTVALRRRIIDRSPALVAESFRSHLRDRVPSWATLEAGGLSLNVVDEHVPEPPRPEGAELADEVNLRGLPKWPQSHMTTSTIGKRVAFRAPIWKAIFGEAHGGDTPSDNRGHRASVTSDLNKGEYASELARIKRKLDVLRDGYEPEWLRVGGTLAAYDAITDHAIVTVPMPKGDIHIHTSLNWTMEWNVPAPAGLAPPSAPSAPAGVRLPELPPAPLAPQAPAPPKPVDPRDAFGAQLLARRGKPT